MPLPNIWTLPIPPLQGGGGWVDGARIVILLPVWTLPLHPLQGGDRWIDGARIIILLPVLEGRGWGKVRGS